MSDSEKGYAESQLEHRPAHPGHGTIGGNLSQQLKTWHANREDRSILLSIPPWPTRTRAHDLPANPFMILRNMSLLCYASFFTGFLCWFCDGLDYFSVSAQRYQKSSVSPRPPCLHCHGASAPSCDLCLDAFHSSWGGPWSVASVLVSRFLFLSRRAEGSTSPPPRLGCAASRRQFRRV